ncbi:hypothetical protein KJ603_00220 [Patescibacteria group bacterium]|nr:hypothetical protein [Patescibacteria group bacterium]
MDFSKMFKKFDFKTFLKFAGIGIFTLLILGLLVSLGAFAFRTAFNTVPKYAVDSVSYNGYGGGYMMEEGIMDQDYKLSVRNINPSIPIVDDGYVTGSDLEDFEITEYNAYIKTARLEKTCENIEALKIREDVVFENSNKGDSYCNYRFKVAKENELEVLEIIKDMNPENLDINTETIKKQIDDYTS